MKSLYDEKYFRYNEDAMRLDEATMVAVRAIFYSYVEKGYNPREVCQVMQSEIWEMSLESLILMGIPNGQNSSNQ